VVDDKVKWVREKAELDFDDEGKCIRGTGFTQDITDRKQAEKQRERLVKTLEYKNGELQDIVYTASHDLRSPLVNIEGFSGELETECGHLMELLAEQSEGRDNTQQIEPIVKEDIPECLRFIKSGAKKMSSLLDGLLQISRIGTVKIKRESLDIDRAVREVLDAMEHQKKVSKITVTVDPLPKCIGDTHMVDHVLTNLISNAIKYRDPAKEGIIRITGKVDGGMSIYCVEDNGIGIASGHQKKVFEIFHRLNPEGSVTGEGLGLTIVTRIMDRLGGKIWLESEAGKGSKFFIALPAVGVGQST
jgi:signal transduction histidine kinase